MLPEATTTRVSLMDAVPRGAGSAMSLPRSLPRSSPGITGAISGALAMLLGLAVLVGWAVHSAVLIQVAPDLPPMERTTAVSFVLSGLALLGIVMSRPRFTFVGSAVTAILAAASFLGIGGLAMPPAAALCFILLATGLVLSQIGPLSTASPILGVAGSLVAALAAVCGIRIIWGGGDAFAWGGLTRMAFLSAGGFLLLGIGAAAVALDMSLAQLRQPAWAPIGASVFVAAVRVGLLQAFSPERQTGISSALAWLGALFAVLLFGVFVHLALKAHLASALLERRVEDRTRALETVNQEFRREISGRQRVEEDLRQQKEILQTIFDHIPVMVGFVDQNGQAQIVNREWERVLGWSLQELRSQHIDLILENYPDLKYREQVQAFIQNSNAEWADFKTKVRDGRVIDTSWAMLHLSDGTGIGIGQDITERKRAEEALRESEERFRQLAENIRDLFWIKTPDFKRVLYLSPIYESMSGRSRQERYRDQDFQPFLDRILPGDREKMAAIMRRGAEAEFDIEFRILRPDGSVRWIRDRGFPIRDQSGRIYRVAGIAQDITERKTAEQALRESEERFRQLAENIHEVFWLRSPDLKQLLYVSPMYEKVCGRSRESLYAAGPELVVHPEDRSRVIETLESLPGREFEIEYRIVTKDGDVRWIRDRGFPIRDVDGAVCRMGGVAEDVTDRKEAEDRLKASSEQLRALSASLQSARETEAARIAHQIHDELGGILTGLRWELEALERMIEQPPDAVQLEAMREKLAAMVGLTDTTINVVRHIASELRPSILDDLGLLEAIEWQTQQFQARTGIQCRCDYSLQSIPLGDQQSTAVFRILQEALTNILRHAQATCVAVAMKEEDGMFTLMVSDNGRGITPAEKRSRESLGLLGMQERALLIGASVDIVGLKGMGTTLHVRVPLPRAASRGAS
jgi:PAS domain S-box-containing protein